ncbi:hypothetical protein CH373_01295 [Leptospira perolatii]|uniref:AB hydrolase-1 domain-containing protein n=1 Tax=Leptospira perolatii TaxID=2023191 RepID=A0A2M9ZRP7_9LEPT|nr:alpha/beta hydrolase [Leptospira perolatii]PJZ71181.1 hypothetical protein CH360_01295 [Leptospira perolatii]PJZ74714.1 hypothetical protein CH373_01295 [Leptospira perolatii]
MENATTVTKETANSNEQNESRKNVLLVHGMWCTKSHMSRVQTCLENLGYNCHTANLPFHEKGEHSQLSNLGISDYVDFLESELDRLQWKSPILLGHSLGGLLVQLLATRINPSALIMLTPVPPLGISGFSWKGTFTVIDILSTPFFWRKTNILGPKKFAYGIYNCLPKEEQELLYKTFVKESGKVAFQTFLPFLDMRLTTRVQHRKIKCPVFIASASHDKVTPPKIGKKLSKKFKVAEYKLYQQCSHWMITEPKIESVLTDADAWLKQTGALTSKEAQQAK